MIKVYPRARVSRHPSLNGWVIELIQRAGAKPKRVAATYSTIVWANRAARLKLGIKPEPAPAAQVPRPRPAPAAQPTPPADPASAGTCLPCNRPMRRAGSKAEDHPGTVLRQRDGICQSCNRKTA